MQFPSRAIWVTSLNSLSTYAICLLIELCQIVVTLCENHFIRPWLRSRTRPLTCYTYNTWKIASTSIHPQIKLHVVPCLSLSKVIYMMYGLYKKKKWKMHTQRRYATCPQGLSKKKREKRCIPKEGMPHAHKACQKKERKYSPYQNIYI